MSESSKRHSKFLSLIFILKCLSKASVVSFLNRFFKLLFEGCQRWTTSYVNREGVEKLWILIKKKKKKKKTQAKQNQKNNRKLLNICST